MSEIKRERPKSFELSDLPIETITPKAEKRDDTTGVDNFKKWFKEMKR